MNASTHPERSGAGAAPVADWLFANSADLLHITDREGRLAQVSAAWTAALSWPEENLLGRPFLDLVHPTDAKRLARADGGESGPVELRLRNSDGEHLWFAARSLALDDGRTLTALRPLATRRATGAVRRTRRSMVVAEGVGMWTFDSDENRVSWSKPVLERLGLRAAEFGSPEQVLARVHARDRKRLRDAFVECLADGNFREVEYRLRGRDDWFTLRLKLRPERRPDGSYAVRGLIQDITEVAEARHAARRGERRAHEARSEAEAIARRLKLALEVAQAGVYEIDHVARRFWASPELVRLAGEDAAYADVTKLRYPRFHPDDLRHVRESFLALHHGAKRSGEGFEARILDPQGRERWVRIFHHLQVTRNGRWLKAVGLVHDIDADKRQELALIEAQRAAEAAGEAKAAFLANMSHEIRTPMNGVLGVLQILKSEPLTPNGRALLEEALSCGRMLAELLNDVIDFSKIEAGRLELAFEPLQPKAVIEGVVNLLKPQADGKGLGLVAYCDPAVGWVRSDPVRLRQALFNLVGNAVKFTEAGGVTVRCQPAGPERLRFEVEDTGIGIPAESQSRVFERFDQGDASTTRRFGGSGLGLTITRRLAELMGGAVGFTSQENVGSTFWLEILAQPADGSQTALVQPQDNALDGVRVLVVEDNATNRIIATKLLEQLGASVETAADGYLGLEAAACGVFDLILMDVQMPGIDGLETTRRLRAMGSPVSDIPIVALTANVLSHQRTAYLDAGMDGVVGKPISPADLLAEIARLSGPAPPAIAKATA